MNRPIKNIMLVVLCIISFMLYLRYDEACYEVGWGGLICKKQMPYNTTPHADRYNVFEMIDEDGFEMIGKGFRYYTTDFIINDILAYGYDDTAIIVKCTDSLDNIRYLLSYKTRYLNGHGNAEVSFKELSSVDVETVNEKYYWVDLKAYAGGEIRRYRTLSFLGVVIPIILLLLQLRKSTRSSNNK